MNIFQKQYYWRLLSLIIILLNFGCVTTSYNEKVLIDKAIKDGVNINNKLSDGSYLLQLAVKQGRIDAVRELLKNNADVNAKTTNTEYALIYAIHNYNESFFMREGADKEKLKSLNYEIIETLLQHGANTNAFDNNGRPPLLLCFDLEMTKLLLEYGAKFTITKNDGSIVKAIDSESPTQIIKLFLAQGGDVEMVENRGTTALMRSAIVDDINTGKELLKKSKKIDAKDSEGYTALMLACKFGNKNFAEILIKNKAKLDATKNDNKSIYKGPTALIIAVREGHYEIAKLLLKNGANPNVNELQMTALHFTKSLRMLNLLLTHGADINWRPLGAETNTLLIDSVRKYPFDYITFICDKGADVNIQGVGGNTALIEAVRAGRYDVVNLLLERKASVNIINSENLTALDYALLNIDDDSRVEKKKIIEANLIVQLLRKHGAKTARELQDEESTTPLTSRR